MTKIKPGDRLRLKTSHPSFPGQAVGACGTIIAVGRDAPPRLAVEWDNGQSASLVWDDALFDLIETPVTLEHQDGCPHCGNRQADLLITDTQGRVIGCEVCQWRSGKEH